MKKLVYIVYLGIIFILSGCYEDYKSDYIYTATYFPLQSPIRTVFSWEDEVSFEVGAVLGGKLNNTRNELVMFGILDSLLQDTTGTKALMPSNYYTIQLSGSDSIITIPSGSFQGAVKVVLNSNFLNDTMSYRDHYVIPFKMYATSADSILEGMDYTLPIVKFINYYHGWYYQKGQERELDAGGQVVSTFIYSQKDIISNRALAIKTDGLKSVIVPAMGKSAELMRLTVNADNSVSYETVDGNDDVIGLSSSYLPAERKFFLNYQYIDDGTTYTVFDTLYYRNTELIYESWVPQNPPLPEVR